MKKSSKTNVKKISNKRQKLIKNSTIQDEINRENLKNEISKVQNVDGIYRENIGQDDEKLLRLFFGE